MHKRVYWDEYDTYQAQMVVEIDSMYTMIWQWAGIYRQEMILDVSPIRIKPIFFQLTRPSTEEHSMKWNRIRGMKTCFGWYQEVRILPISFKLVVNFMNCYMSVFNYLFMDGELDYWCKYVPDKRIATESTLVWQGYRLTVPIWKKCWAPLTD